MNPVCHWKSDDDDGDSLWETDCGHAFEFNVGGPMENGFRFCGYCGKPLVEMRTSEEAATEAAQ